MNTAVTVSMPFHGCHSTVRKAVEAVLAQTVRDLRLVVVNDGDPDPPWPELEGIDDPRLTRFSLPTNQGRYYCDAVVLAACDSPWFAIHDADDWAEPDWLETLLDAAEREEAVAAFAPQWVHPIGRPAFVEPMRPWRKLQPRMRQLAHHAGLYRTSALRKVGIHPQYRVGFDTLLVNLMVMAGPVAAVDRPLYHRVARVGSLTNHPQTGFASGTRRRAATRLNRMYQAALRRGPVGLVHRDTPPPLRRQVDHDANRLVGRVVVNVRDWPTDEWALPVATAHELAEMLQRRQPRLVVEAGSGATTVLLGDYAKATGARVISLEHDPRFGARTRRLLEHHGHTRRVELRVVPLRPLDTPAGARPWYATDLPEGIDFALIDGPPESTGGRAAALFALHPHLSPDGWEVWLDDAHRPGEQQALAAWAAALGVAIEVVPLPRGLARITASPQLRTPVDATDVAVTLLTGRRPDLLAATVDALQQCAPGLLDSAHVTVLHNGGDEPTAQLLADWLWIDVSYTSDGWLPVGPAVSQLIQLAPSPRPYLLHLEDDWAAGTLADGWLPQARAALQDKQIGQVRLRHYSEPVRVLHLVTGRPIHWATTSDGWAVADAHYTLNPSLMRRPDAAWLWPAAGEQSAARRFKVAGLHVAQLKPGVFHHIGDDRSLEGHEWKENPQQPRRSSWR